MADDEEEKAKDKGKRTKRTSLDYSGAGEGRLDDQGVVGRPKMSEWTGGWRR